jgi:phosphoheptose isomerase
MKLVILDRDGVINRDSDDFIKSPDEWVPLPGSLEAIARLHRAGYTIAVATNQSGVARGLFSRETLERIHERMNAAVEDHGGRIDRIVYCPHGPREGCSCRKPAPGMMLRLAGDYGRPLAGVFAVGDSERDLVSARGASARPVLVRTGKGRTTEATSPELDDVAIFDDLAAFTDALVSGKLGADRGLLSLAPEPRIPKMMDNQQQMAARYAEEFDRHSDVTRRTREALEGPFRDFVEAARHSLNRGGKLLFFGNGGSAADAQHLATELGVRYKQDRAAIAALALTTDTSTLTAAGNDLGFDRIFSRQIEALGREGDVAIAISTSGTSRNVLKALEQARAMKLVTAALTGRDGGGMPPLSDHCLIVPSNETARIQEMHILIGHMFCDALEAKLGRAD